MVAPFLHALSCSKCGAALALSPGQQILTCQYCAQAHVFVPPPPPESPGTAYTPGDRVAVEWGGHWWPATLLAAVGRHEWRVHFDGWDDDYDTVVGPSRIRHISQATSRVPGFKLLPFVVFALSVVVIGGSMALYRVHAQAPEVVQAPAVVATYAAGDAVQIEWNNSWYPGRVVEVDGARYKVTYDSYSSTMDEWVEASRLRARAAPPPKDASPSATYAAGDAVQIEWHGSWYPGRIVEVAGARYKITYDGYSSSWDEWVEVSRLRRP